MAIKTFKPYTPSRRNMTVSAFEGVDKKAKPERSLVETLKKNAGRNSYVTSPSVIVAAATSVSIVSSTSSVRSWIWKQLSSVWSTTPTAAHLLL